MGHSTIEANMCVVGFLRPSTSELKLRIQGPWQGGTQLTHNSASGHRSYCNLSTLYIS